MSEKTIEQQLKALEEEEAEVNALLDAEPSLEEKLAEKKQKVADKKALADAISKYGKLNVKIAAYPTELGIVIFQRPSAGQMKHMAHLKDTSTPDAVDAFMRTLVTSCVVHPSKDKLAEILENEGALLYVFPQCLQALAGANRKALGNE